MADKAWKAWEREVAKDHGGIRTGPTGRDTPDVSGLALVAPECKYLGRLAFNEADMQQARDNAGKVGLMPVVLIKEKGNGRRAVRLDYADWLRIYKLACIGAQVESMSPGAPMPGRCEDCNCEGCTPTRCVRDRFSNSHEST